MIVVRFVDEWEQNLATVWDENGYWLGSVAGEVEENFDSLSDALLHVASVIEGRARQ